MCNFSSGRFDAAAESRDEMHQLDRIDFEPIAFGGWGAFDDERDFAERFFGQARQKFADGNFHDLFVKFCSFAEHRNDAVAAQNFYEVLNTISNAMRGFEENERSRFVLQFFEAAATARWIRWKESFECKGACTKGGNGNGRRECGRAWNGFDAKALLMECAQKAGAGIGNTGSAAVGDKDEVFAVANSFQDLRDALYFPGTEEGDQRFLGKAELLEQESGAASVLGENCVRFFQCGAGARR